MRTSPPTAASFAALAISLIFAGTGCGKKSSAPQAFKPEEAGPTLTKAFQNAPAEVKAQASDAVAALQSQDDVRAFVGLEKLTAKPELTPEQREAAVRSWLLAQMRLHDAASNGNPAAQSLLEKYRATK